LLVTARKTELDQPLRFVVVRDMLDVQDAHLLVDLADDAGDVVRVAELALVGGNCCGEPKRPSS
jgi:hypothetical protein